MPRIDLTVVIVNYNTCGLLLACIDSIVKNTSGLDFEIIVVDNASSDNSVESLRKQFPVVKIIANEQNRGFASANNQGIRASRGRYVLLLNSDTVVSKDCFKVCMEYMEHNSTIGVLGAQVRAVDGSIQKTCFRQPNILSEIIFFAITINFAIADPITRYKWMSSYDRQSMRDVDCLAGCFLFIRKEVFDRVGYLSEKFFMYYEDAEFCGRVRRGTNYKIVYYPYANIIHYGAMSVAPDNNFKTRLGYVSARCYFLIKFGGMISTFFNAICKGVWLVEVILFLPFIFFARFRNKIMVISKLILT